MSAVKNWAKLVVAASTVAVLAGGCSSTQAESKPAVTASDVTACHTFGNQLIIHGSTTTKDQIIVVAHEVGLASHPNLRREADALLAAATSGTAADEQSAAENIAKTCYSLGLVSRTGQPT
ncbi:MAG TPA: hypothetical protein VIC86_03835 [Acidimicrobiales bacterium]